MLPRLRLTLDLSLSHPGETRLAGARPLSVFSGDPDHSSGFRRVLRFFDGDHSRQDLLDFLVPLAGNLEAKGLVEHLEQALGQAGFLDGEEFRKLEGVRREGICGFRDEKSRARWVSLP